MATLQEIQARQQALKAAQSDGAVPGSTTGEAKSVISVGLQGSAEQVTPIAELPKVTIELDKELAKESAGVYKDEGLKKYASYNGTWLKPINGYFYAKDSEEVAQLEHYAAIGKVAKVEIK